MNAHQLFADLTHRGVKLTASGDRLSVDAPKGTMTDELRQLLLAHKAELLAMLQDDLQPTRPCHSCHALNWRQRPPERGGGWLCGACHPDFEHAYRAWMERRR